MKRIARIEACQNERLDELKELNEWMNERGEKTSNTRMKGMNEWRNEIIKRTNEFNELQGLK